MNIKTYDYFKDLNFEDFKNLAKDKSLSKYEKIGFPNSYRENYESFIFEDIKNKLKNIELKNKIILDIGPGCSDLPKKLISVCEKNEHKLILIDSKEMLQHLPDHSFVEKIEGKFPDDCISIFKDYRNKIDTILAYSVFQYVFKEMNPFTFIDKILSLLNDNGESLIGDIPNNTKRKRYFSSNGS